MKIRFELIAGKWLGLVAGFLFLLTGPLLAQFGKIIGTITEAKTGDPLPGANVVLTGTEMGTAVQPHGAIKRLFVIQIPRSLHRFFLTSLLFLAILIAGNPATGQERFDWSAYGEMRYQHFDFGPDQKSGERGSPPDSRAILDIPRFVLEAEYELEHGFEFVAEIEFEHGGTGSALELEYEEFGEYEFESESGGEVVVEEFYLQKTFSPFLKLRAGHFILPIGLINSHHKPTQYSPSRRPESTTELIPVTWHETGIDISGKYSNLHYQLQLVNGLDATGFNSKHWIRDGHQTRFEVAKATDLALTARVDYSGIPGALIGVSGYRGNSTANRPKPDMEGTDGTVTIGEVHARYHRDPWRIQGEFLYGHVNNSIAISQKNARLSANLEVLQTPVAAGGMAYYGEIGYDVFSLAGKEQRDTALYPFFRYDYINSMEQVNDPMIADTRFERHIFTAGLNFFATQNIVVKADYSHRAFGTAKYNTENTISLAVGFLTD